MNKLQERGNIRKKTYVRLECIEDEKKKVLYGMVFLPQRCLDKFTRTSVKEVV